MNLINLDVLHTVKLILANI